MPEKIKQEVWSVTLPRGYRWTDRDSDGTYWELLAGKRVIAEIVLTESTSQWAWYFTLPPEWLVSRSPTGYAKSCEACKLICVAIVSGIAK